MIRGKLHPGWLSFLLLAAHPAAAADRLSVPDARGGDGAGELLPLSIAGTSPVTAMQFDVEFAASVLSVGPAVASTTTTNHVADSRLIAAGRRRVVLYSRSNAVLPKDVILDLPLSPLPGSGGVAPMIHLRNIAFTLADGTRVIPSIERGSIFQWFDAFFSQSEMENPLLTGDDADPDHDGLPNLLEYALDGHPKGIDRNLMPSLQAVLNAETGETMWSYYFIRPALPLGVMVGAETSRDLEEWNSATAIPTGNEDGQRFEFKFNMPYEPGTSRFFRLKVQRLK